MLLHGDVAHRLVRRCAVPVFHARWNPHDITGADHLPGFTPQLHAAESCCHDQDLTAWMAVPRSARAGGKGHDRAGGTGGRGGVEQAPNRDLAGEVLSGSAARPNALRPGDLQSRRILRSRGYGHHQRQRDHTDTYRFHGCSGFNPDDYCVKSLVNESEPSFHFPFCFT